MSDVPEVNHLAVRAVTDGSGEMIPRSVYYSPTDSAPLGCKLPNRLSTLSKESIQSGLYFDRFTSARPVQPGRVEPVGGVSPAEFSRANYRLGIHQAERSQGRENSATRNG